MYFITAMETPKLSELGFPNMATRCFGYLPTEKEARTAVEENWCDLQERSYSFAVIEKIEAGIHARNTEIAWYEWHEDKEAFIPCERPEILNQFINWSQVG